MQKLEPTGPQVIRGQSASTRWRYHSCRLFLTAMTCICFPLIGVPQINDLPNLSEAIHCRGVEPPPTEVAVSNPIPCGLLYGHRHLRLGACTFKPAKFIGHTGRSSLCIVPPLVIALARYDATSLVMALNYVEAAFYALPLVRSCPQHGFSPFGVRYIMDMVSGCVYFP